MFPQRRAGTCFLTIAPDLPGSSPFVLFVMEILERIWEIIAGIGNAILGRFEKGITGIFGSANARFLKRLQPKVEAINALEPKYQAMTDEELRNQTAEFRRR